MKRLSTASVVWLSLLLLRKKYKKLDLLHLSAQWKTDAANNLRLVLHLYDASLGMKMYKSGLSHPNLELNSIHTMALRIG